MIGLLLPGKCLVCGVPPHPCCAGCRPEPAVREFYREHSPPLRGFSAGRYTPELAKLLGAFKDSGQLWLLDDLKPLARAALASALAGCSTGDNPLPAETAATPASALTTEITEMPDTAATPHFITYLSSSTKNYRKRGYNPALKILRSVAHEFKLPVVKTLVPGRSVLDQANLSAPERAENLANSLRLARRPFDSWRQALLFDDVVTTGSTLLAAREALRSVRVEVVAVATLADVELRNQVS